MISIHALREEGDSDACDFWQDGEISIHALREEGDTAASCRTSWIVHFYPRPPRGGRPPKLCYSFAECQISIHALREEGDAPLTQ